ncbi:hypothetical protein [Pontibacter chitinilyticus]|uniref:hypothetical protein n=1 Tax=Pontibacter chitinilyticus TaxID=2674989 RepID=UPI00321ACA4A
MLFKTMYESDFNRIRIDTNSNLLYAEWLRPVNEEEIKIGSLQLTEVLLATRIQRALVNLEVFGALTAEVKEWIVTTLYEALLQTSLQKLARVLPDNVFYRLALESIVTRAEALHAINFPIQNFCNQQEALKWLTKEAILVTPAIK